MNTVNATAERPLESPMGDEVLAQLGIAVAAFDADLHITAANRVMRSWIGSRDNMADAVQVFQFDQGLGDWRGVFARVIDSGRPRYFDALCDMRAPAQPRFYRMVIAAANGDLGSLNADPGLTLSMTGGMVLMEEITSRIKLEQRLAASERLAALGELAAKVAHELNNPLDGILRYVNLAIRLAGQQIGDDVGDPHGQPKTVDRATPAGAGTPTNAGTPILDYLQHARSGLMRMIQIVGSLLEYSRSARAGPQASGVNALIEEAIRTFETRASAASVTVVCSFHQEDLAVARGASLFQVFCNLIKNAIDAMPSGGTLTVKTRAVGREMTITFEDTGIGLPAEEDRLFEPFFTTKPVGQGTGLGLAVCKEIVEKYAGRITAGRRPEVGSVFTVYLPREERETAAGIDERR